MADEGDHARQVGGSGHARRGPGVAVSGPTFTADLHHDAFDVMGLVLQVAREILGAGDG